MFNPEIEFGTMQSFGLTLALSFALIIAFAGITLLTMLGALIWKWIDEAKRVEPCLVTKLLKRLIKTPWYDNFNRYFTAFIVIFFTPLVIWFVMSFVNFTLILVVIFAMAHLTRYVRRLHKQFVKHTQDKEAHK